MSGNISSICHTVQRGDSFRQPPQPQGQSTNGWSRSGGRWMDGERRCAGCTTVLDPSRPKWCSDKCRNKVYSKRWRTANRDVVRDYQKRNKARVNAYRRQDKARQTANANAMKYRRAHRDKVLAAARKYRAANRDKYRAAYARSRDKHREAIRQRKRLYHHNNRELRIEACRQWRQRQRIAALYVILTKAQELADDSDRPAHT